MTVLRDRTRKISEEYWESRKHMSERVAVAQLCLAYAVLDTALMLIEDQLVVGVPTEDILSGIRGAREDPLDRAMREEVRD